MTPRRAARIAATVTFAAIAVFGFGRAALDGPLALVLNGLALVVLLGAPLAAAVWTLTYRWRMVVDSRSPVGSRETGGDEWIAALRNELASLDDPGERRPFARALLAVVVRRTLTLWTWLVAATVAAALALSLLALSRAETNDGVGTFTLLVPPVVFFVVGWVAARRHGSYTRGLVVAATAAVLTGLAMLPVAAVEASRLYTESGVSFFDGEPITAGSSSAAVFDALHPVFLVLHALFWLPGPVLGARFGSRPRPVLAQE